MSEKKISYLSRTFDDYKQSLREYVAKYYPQITDSLDDASIGAWIIDIVAAVSDNLSFHIDRTYNETNIDSAQQSNSVFSLARNSGFKVPGPKASVAEVTFSCEVPAVMKLEDSNDPSEYGMPNKKFLPVIKQGTKLSSGNQIFEVMNDIDFAEVMDYNGYSDKTVYPLSTNAKGEAITYEVTKKALVVAGESKVYKQIISAQNITPFMEIILPDKDILSVESIIFKDGENYTTDPAMSEFMNPNEYVPASDSPYGCDTWRFFEVNSLLEQYRWGDDVTSTRVGEQNIGHAVKYTYGYFDSKSGVNIPTYAVTKGEWVPLTQKFMTEYTNNGYLKIVFGSGEMVGHTTDYSAFTDFSKYQVTKMVRNNFLGRLPRAGWTMYVLYRVGGGAASNVAANTIKRFAYLNMEVGKAVCTTDEQNMLAAVKNSLTCTNEQPSVSGKDAPTPEEIKMLIKYNSAAQERCVTLKDYENRVLMMPARYGSPFRVSAVEENNKVMLYLLGIDNNGRLSDKIPTLMVNNIQNYLSMYRSINDYVEIKNGRIINISIEMYIFISKAYSSADVIADVTKTIRDYMDVSKHELGEDIFIGDIEKEVGNVDGVLNVSETKVFNEFNSDLYSGTISTQLTTGDWLSGQVEIDLEANQYVLNSEPDEMFEIKYPNKDIRIYPIVR